MALDVREISPILYLLQDTYMHVAHFCLDRVQFTRKGRD